MRRSQANNLPWFARQLARLSFDLEALEPPELRGAQEDCARWLLRLAGVVVE